MVATSKGYTMTCLKAELSAMMLNLIIQVRKSPYPYLNKTVVFCHNPCFVRSVNNMLDSVHFQHISSFKSTEPYKFCVVGEMSILSVNHRESLIKVSYSLSRGDSGSH